MAVLRTPRFAQAVVACVLGVGACGIAVALAGPTPRPPREPVDLLPADVTVDKDYECFEKAMAPFSPTTTIDVAGPEEEQPCWHVSVLTSPDETSNELTERLAEHFRGKGYELSGGTATEALSFYGSHPVCRTILALDSGSAALSTGIAGGAVTGFGPAIDPTTGLPIGASQLVPSDPTLGGAIPGDPAASTPADPNAATDPTAPPALDPGVTAPVAPLDPTFMPPGIGSALSGATSGDQRPAIVVMASQQARSVVPRSAEGQC